MIDAGAGLEIRGSGSSPQHPLSSSPSSFLRCLRRLYFILQQQRSASLVWSAALFEMIASGSADDAGDASASADASVECTRGSSAELCSSLHNDHCW